MKVFRLLAVGAASLSLVLSGLVYCPCPTAPTEDDEHACCAREAGLRAADQRCCGGQVFSQERAAERPLTLAATAPVPSAVAPAAAPARPSLSLPHLPRVFHPPPTTEVLRI